MVPGLNTSRPEELVRDYGGMVTSICRRMIQNEVVAQEAAQEVWLAIFKSLSSFKGESKLSTWIYTLTSRVVMGYAKNEQLYSVKFLKNHFHGEALTSPVAEVVAQKLWVKEMCDKCLTGILRCLDVEHRLAYIFRDVVQISYQDIAYCLNKDATTVRKMLSRTRKKLKHFLNDECSLYNQNSKCKCRMNKLVTEINLPLEYQRLYQLVGQVNLYRESEKILPRKNYWEKYI